MVMTSDFGLSCGLGPGGLGFQGLGALRVRVEHVTVWRADLEVHGYL